MELVEYNPAWEKLYEQEADRIKVVLGDRVLDIQHIGSTAIKGMRAKPVIDIMVLIRALEEAHACVDTLSRIEYSFYPESSSSERLFFRKGDPVQYHLSLTQQGGTSYWERQIVFRDYLRMHPELVIEYEALKQSLLRVDPSARQVYSEGKASFVKKVLDLAGFRG